MTTRRNPLVSACLAAALGAGCAFPGGGAAAVDRTWPFDDDAVGATPAGFEAAVGDWKVAADDTAPSGERVLAQLARNSRPTFNVALASGTSYRDVDLAVSFRAVSGEIDQGGGLVWRARDAQNYYIMRYNPLEANFRVYTVVDGRRRQLESADVEPEPGWHTLRVVARGDRIECFYDGERHLDVRDSTFPEAGMVGLWTKADAVTRFDDLAALDLGGGGLDAAGIGAAAGAEATTTPDGVVRIGWPRTDVAVTVDGVPLRPFAGLGSWAAFKATDGGAMVMGDTVVFEDEATPAMDAAFASGLEVTALHNHFFFDEPKVYFMHVGGRGDPETLAAAVKRVWDAIRAVRRASPQPVRTFGGAVPRPGAFDRGALEAAIGHGGTLRDGVLKVSIAREGAMHGVAVGGSMGLSTWVAFSGSDALAAIDGDFIMTAAEVQPVLRALRKAGIHVVALHNHMVGETPTFYFTHFWGKGPAADLARGIRAALDAQARAAEHRAEGQ